MKKIQEENIMSNKNTSNLDKAIQQSLSKEDQDFLAGLDKEPGYMDQAMGVFKGRLGWISWMGIIVRILMAIVLLYALARFENTAPDIESMFKWGGLSAFCVLVMAFNKLWMSLHLQTNRVLRELKKLELQIASLKQD
jgi:hypothetical protein